MIIEGHGVDHIETLVAKPIVKARHMAAIFPPAPNTQQFCTITNPKVTPYT